MIREAICGLLTFATVFVGGNAMVSNNEELMQSFNFTEKFGLTSQNEKPVRNEQPMNRIVMDKNYQVDGIEEVTIDIYNDPAISMQWAIEETGSYLIWDQIDQKQTITIAVIDTGVDYTHEDLVNRVSLEYGYDFVNNDNDPMDDNGHGTHVAGIIAAEANNGLGIVGMVGDLDVEIIPIKALDSEGSGELDDVVNAISYAIDLDVDIINMSMGTTSRSTELDAIVEKAIAADIFVVVAAGNEGTVVGASSPTMVEGVCTVGASDVDSSLADFSNYGNNVDIIAPGVKIVSTLPDNQYASQDGTSMAAPIISSLAAMLRAEDPTLTVNELLTLICSQSSGMMQNMGQSSTTSVVNFYQAMSQIADIDELEMANTLQTQTPQMEVPQMEIPQVQTPQVTIPQVQTPQVTIPQVQTPQSNQQNGANTLVSPSNKR